MLANLLVYLTVAGNLLLAAVVHRKNSQSASNRLISALAILFAIWTGLNFFSQQAFLPEHTRTILIQAVMAVTAPAAPVIYLFAQSFPLPTLQLSNRKLLGLLALNLSIMVLSFTNFLFAEVRFFPDGSFMLIPGVGIILYAVNVLAFLTAGLLLLVRKYRTASGVLRQQLKVILFGMATSFSLLTITNFLAVVLLGTTELTQFGPPLTLLMVGSMTYAAAKHKFLDIKLAIVRSLSFSLLLFAVAGCISLVVIFIINLIEPNDLSTEALVTLVIMTLSIAYYFAPLKQFLQSATERMFYTKYYESEAVLQELGSLLTATLRLNVLAKETLHVFLTVFSVQNGLITLKEDGVWKIVERRGFSSKATAQMIDAYDQVVAAAVKRNERVILLDTLSESEFKQQLRDWKVSALLLLRTQNRSAFGTVVLGERKSGEGYQEKDVVLMSMSVPQISVAFQNALAFDKISKFNRTLKQEVSRATAKLKEANTELKQLDLLKDEFVSIASHELRTPMTAIKDYLWMALEGKGGELTQKQQYYLERSYSATERLIKLVNNLLNISRIESGRVSLELVKVELAQLIFEVIEEVNGRALQRKIALKFSPDPQSGWEVVADADKIKEVLINLIGNSLKFTEPGGSVTVSLQRDAGKVTVSVEDTGAGIPAENIGTLFQKFGLLEGSYRTNQEASQGTGLGLYISRTIIEMHGGQIWAESQGRGKGAIFRFTLPVFSSQAQLKQLQAQFGEATDAGIIPNSV